MSNKEDGHDDMVINEDGGGSVTIGETVILLEQLNEEDWCIVTADA